MKKAIIFDVDGTIWDACGVIAESWNEYAALYAPDVESAATESLVRALCGQTMDRFAAVMFPKSEPKRGMEVTEGACRYEVDVYLKDHPGQPYPHLEEVLQILSETYPLYIVSNCQSGYIEVMLEGTGLGKYFEDIECYGNTMKQKHDNIRILMERNAIDDAIYLGDTQGDFEAASMAGVRFLHAAYGFGSVTEPTEAITDIRELPGAVEKLFAGSCTI